MNDATDQMSEELASSEACKIFEREIGAPGVQSRITSVGGQKFLKFIVGREAPLYKHALRETQKHLSDSNPFLGGLGLAAEPAGSFPESLEATVLITLLTRSTRAVSQDTSDGGFSVPYVPFQNREDHQLAQPATHVVLGRRGVGKSTLIKSSIDILKASAAVVTVIDAQAYSMLSGDDLAREILFDVVSGVLADSPRAAAVAGVQVDLSELRETARRVSSGEITAQAAVPRLKRELQNLTKSTRNGVYLFLDDYHLLDSDEQPRILHLLHGAVKGANGWLKVAGLRTLLNNYSSKTRMGLQVPGDAQQIPLDLTLENPEAAESHLRAILGGFLKAIGYSSSGSVLPEAAFRRLAWANAGVPRDFLQMFVRAIEHARRNRHSIVTLSDVNIAIGELGQRKIDDLEQDARNAAGELRKMLSALEGFCLDERETNGFLLKSDESTERRLVHILSDLRLVHLINQSITPDRAGERYEAFILDYSLFTGFRRRPNIKEMVPEEGQFKASELRGLPKVSEGFLDKRSAS